MTSPITSTMIVEEPPSTIRSVGDVEAQQSFTRRRPSGVRRADTSSSFDSTSMELKSIPKRRDTLISNDSTRTSPILEREPTWRVEDEALDGYPKLAKFLGGTEGYAIYKRFAALNARNLLYHQAKLTRLEHELNDLEKEFPHEKDLHYKVDHIFREDFATGTAAYKLRKKYEEVSHALEKYNKLLLEQRQLHELPRPDPTFVNSIYNFINSEKGDKPDWLQHPENTVYAIYDDNREPIQKDLVTLNQEFKQQDPFTKFFISTFINWWHRLYSLFKKPDGDFDEYIYSEKALSRAMGVIVIAVASVLPTCSIVALYFIHSSIWRLVFIVLFSVLFSLALAIFTDAKRVEIFAASATLASVQVVFVGTAFGGGNGLST